MLTVARRNPAFLSGAASMFQQMAVGRQRQVQRLAAWSVQPPEFLNQLHNPAAQEWLAARQLYL